MARGTASKADAGNGDMLYWLQDNLPEGYLGAILWVSLALILLILVLFFIRLFRRMRPGTFVLGGRNRRTRLAVMDAMPVDSRRRLVLVRRDDVEHLILIGGPSDLLVEQGIRMVPRNIRPTEQAAGEAASPGPTQADLRRARAMVARDPAAQPVAARPAAASKPAAPQAPVSRPVTAAQAEHQAAASQPAAVARPPAATSPSAPARSGNLPNTRDTDRKLLDDIDLSVDELKGSTGVAKPSPDEQMERLLGELTGRKAPDQSSR